MRNVLYICFCLLGAIKAFAQLPHDFRSEQIFLGVARTEWAVNDTICANGVVTCLANKDYAPYSRYLYIELLNSNDSVIVRQKVACNSAGEFHAAIPTVSVYDEGIYYLRAYTNLMRNFSSESFAMQPLLIGKTFAKRGRNIVNDVNCSIYPDGGFLVADNVQGITISLTDNLGDALGRVNTCVVDDNADTVCVGKTLLSGLLNLKFIPQTGKNYRLLVDKDGISHPFDLPKATHERMKVQCVTSGNRLKFEILNAKPSLSNNRLYIYNKENGLARIEFVRPTGIIMLHNQPRITTMFLTDSVGNVLSECTAMSRYDMVTISETPDTIKVGRIDSLATMLTAGGTTRALVRLVAKDERWIQTAESDLVYTSDYSSPLMFPERFGMGDKNMRAADLQAWLNTATFKRFSLPDAIAKDTAMYMYMPETNMTMSGCVSTEYRATFRNGTLLAYNTSNNHVYDAYIGRDGRFRIAVDDFDDGTTFFLQAIDKYERPEHSVIAIDDATYPSVAAHRKYRLQNSDFVESETIVSGTMKGRVLPDVVVKARVRHDKPLSREKFYSINFFDRDRIEKYNYLTLLDILMAMPSVIVTEKARTSDKGRMTDDETGLYNRRGFSTFTGKESLPILLDGTRLMGSMISPILKMSAEEIESVEMLQAWQALAYTWGALDGAIKVTTRGFNKPQNIRAKGTFYTPMGLSAAEQPKQDMAPGNYRLLVDVLSPHGITSYEHDVVVVE